MAPAVLLCEPRGVSQNPILWEPLPWQGIPAGNRRPHPRHGHSRGPPPLGLQRHHGYTQCVPAARCQGPDARWPLTGRRFGCVFPGGFGSHSCWLVSVRTGRPKRGHAPRPSDCTVVCVTVCADGVGACSVVFEHAKVPEWPLMSSVEYLSVSTSPSRPSVCRNRKYNNKPRLQMRPPEFRTEHAPVHVDRQ